MDPPKIHIGIPPKKWGNNYENFLLSAIFGP
jgi:hypothetical protein